ncbi:MAG: HEPN domain-containing protein, partial [Anaerolineaceae bacterium]|nr:HEPN domain-containing protein [Anaerolineaceae bacterium]
MNMDEELLKIAEKDLQASQVLYENGLYPQAVFSFQQSVEKANKAFALITNQATEKELTRNIGHIAIRIYLKPIEQQKIKYEQFDKQLSEIPELRNTKLLKGFNVRRDIRQFEHFLSYLKKLDKNKNESIYLSSWDIRRFLKE